MLKDNDITSTQDAGKQINLPVTSTVTFRHCIKHTLHCYEEEISKKREEFGSFKISLQDQAKIKHLLREGGGGTSEHLAACFKIIKGCEEAEKDERRRYRNEINALLERYFQIEEEYAGFYVHATETDFEVGVLPEPKDRQDLPLLQGS